MEYTKDTSLITFVKRELKATAMVSKAAHMCAQHGILSMGDLIDLREDYDFKQWRNVGPGIENYILSIRTAVEKQLAKGRDEIFDIYNGHVPDAVHLYTWEDDPRTYKIFVIGNELRCFYMEFARGRKGGDYKIYDELPRDETSHLAYNKTPIFWPKYFYKVTGLDEKTFHQLTGLSQYKVQRFSSIPFSKNLRIEIGKMKGMEKKMLKVYQTKFHIDSNQAHWVVNGMEWSISTRDISNLTSLGERLDLR